MSECVSGMSVSLCSLSPRPYMRRFYTIISYPLMFFFLLFCSLSSSTSPLSLFYRRDDIAVADADADWNATFVCINIAWIIISFVHTKLRLNGKKRKARASESWKMLSTHWIFQFFPFDMYVWMVYLDSASHPLMHHQASLIPSRSRSSTNIRKIQIYSTYKFIILRSHKALSQASIQNVTC